MLALLVLLAEAMTVAVFGLYMAIMNSMYRDPGGRDAQGASDPVGRSLVLAARFGFLTGLCAVVGFSLAGALQ